MRRTNSPIRTGTDHHPDYVLIKQHNARGDIYGLAGKRARHPE
jgi:hypothetical protein